MPKYRFVSYLWDDEKAASLDPVGRLVYRSNLLGSDQRVTNTGGGNTSCKLVERDPLTGKPVQVLWVKGSGGEPPALPSNSECLRSACHFILTGGLGGW